MLVSVQPSQPLTSSSAELLSAGNLQHLPDMSCHAWLCCSSDQPQACCS